MSSPSGASISLRALLGGDLRFKFVVEATEIDINALGSTWNSLHESLVPLLRSISDKSARRQEETAP